LVTEKTGTENVRLECIPRTRVGPTGVCPTGVGPTRVCPTGVGPTRVGPTRVGCLACAGLSALHPFVREADEKLMFVEIVDGMVATTRQCHEFVACESVDVFFGGTLVSADAKV
jgi:hypothetical protein